MNIVTYTNLKQLGFRLSKDDFAALVRMDEARRSGAAKYVRLERNLMKFPDVPFAEIGPAALRSVYADFCMSDDQDEYCVSEGDVRDVIASYVRAARALDRFLPGYEDPEANVRPRQLSPTGAAMPLGDFPSGHLLHVDDDFVVLSDGRGKGATVHFLRDGEPCFTFVHDTSEIEDLFAHVLRNTLADNDDEVVIWSEDDDRVRSWAIRFAPVPLVEESGRRLTA